MTDIPFDANIWERTSDLRFVNRRVHRLNDDGDAIGYTVVKVLQQKWICTTPRYQEEWADVPLTDEAEPTA